MDIPLREKGVYRFGPYRLDPIRRTLARDGTPVKLPARLFDLLLVMVQNHDRLLERDELLSTVWHGRTVVEGNLGQAISTLRRALQGESETETYIVTAPGRGYRFGAPVEFEPFGAKLSLAVATGQPAAADVANPARAWRAAALAGAALALVFTLSGAVVWGVLASRPLPPKPSAGEGFAPPPHSLGVMAFANMSGDPAQDYVSDGLSEELIGAFSRIGAMRVAARRSAFSFKGGHATVGEIARRLNVGAVLDGSLRRVGNRLRITVELTDAVTGFQVWAQTYDRQQDDILNVQGEIAASVVSALQIKLLGDEAAQLTLGGTRNPRAFDAYLRSVQIQRSSRPDADKAALAALDDAIALDPSFAIARAKRAWMHTTWDGDLDPAGIASKYAQARAEAETAVALAPALGVAHATLGGILELCCFDFRHAAIEMSRALDLAPGDARTNQFYAQMQIHLGHADEAVRAAQYAVTLDPLTPVSYRNLAGILNEAGRNTEALAAQQRAIALEPAATAEDLDSISKIEASMGDYIAARRGCAPGATWWQLQCLALAHHALGDQPAAEAAFAKLRSMVGDAGAIQFVQVYAQWGRTADAVRWLHKAYDLRDPGLAELKVAPWIESIRGTSDYRDVIAKLDFPP